MAAYKLGRKTMPEKGYTINGVNYSKDDLVTYKR